MAGRLLLDTNAVVALLSGDPGVLNVVQPADDVFIPSIVLGELYYGAFRSTRVAENLSRVEAFAQGRSILVCDGATARLYGEIKSKLRAKGRPIPENDLWISALGLQYEGTIVTRDRHFHEVESLSVEEPA